MANLITQLLGQIDNTAPNLDNFAASVFERNDPLESFNQIGRYFEREQATIGKPGALPFSAPGGEPKLDPAALDHDYGIAGPTPELSLKFTEPLPASVAQSISQAKRAEIARTNAQARTPTSAATVLTDLGVGFLDPVGFAAGALPIVGEVGLAARLGRVGIAVGDGILGRTALRAGAGAISGAAGMVPIEALNMVLSHQEYRDVTMWDAAKSVAFGAVLGGILHPTIGGIGDMIGGRISHNSGDADAAAMHTAVAGVLDGTPVNVAPMLDGAGLTTAMQARLAARGATAEGSYRAYAPNGMTVDLRPEVVEADSLVASHHGDGTVNPAYPHEAGLQPRDRTSPESQAQIVEMASRLEPERLAPSPEVSMGAPIVNGDHVVESGNGRIMALRRVYGDPALADQAAAYRAFLEAHGYDVSGMKTPVLIGRRTTEFTPVEARAFARSGNERTTLDLNETERARSDIGRVSGAIDQWKPGRLKSSANQGFIAAFMRDLPTEERAGLSSKGVLTPLGERRVRNAMLAHAYGDDMGPTLSNMLHGEIDDMRSTAGGLIDAAGKWGQMRAAAARGQIPAGLDISPALGEAVQLIERANRTDQSLASLLAQIDALHTPSPTTLALLHLMFSDENLRRPLARARLAELLDHYADQALQAKPGAGIFGEPETTTTDLLRNTAGASKAAQAAIEEMAEHARQVEAYRAAGGDDAPAIRQATEAGTRVDQTLGEVVAAAPEPAVKPASIVHEDIARWKIGDALPEDVAVAEARSAERAANPTFKIDTPERSILRATVVAETIAERLKNIGGTPELGRRALIVMGGPASGKSNLVDPLALKFKALVIDSDDMKAKLPEYDNGTGAAQVHDESAAMADGLELDAMKQGTNIVRPVVGATQQGLATRIERLKAAGYHVSLLYNDLPLELAAQRAMVRFRQTGRVVPMEYLLGLEDRPRRSYNALKEYADDQALYSNDVQPGRPPEFREGTDVRGELGYDPEADGPLRGSDVSPSATAGGTGEAVRGSGTGQADPGQGSLTQPDPTSAKPGAITAPPEPDLADALAKGLITPEDARDLSAADTAATDRQSALKQAASCIAKGVL